MAGLALALALVSGGAAHSQEFKKENHSYSAYAQGAFSEVVVISGPAKMIYLAGIGAEEPTGEGVRHIGDFPGQCRFMWSKVKKVLAANGATLRDIVKVTTYVTDIRYREDMRKCRKETFEGVLLPPHTLLNVVALARPGMLIEVDVVAAVAAK